MRHLPLPFALTVVILAFLAGTALSTAPTPLYPLYEERFGIDAFGVTVLFAAFAVGAVVGLVLIAPRAGRIGRRALFALSCGFLASAALVLALVPGLAGFAVGRVLTGLGVGVLASSMTVYLRALASLDPRSRAARSAVAVAPALSMIGLALGPLATGLAAPVDAPGLTRLYLGYSVLLAGAAALAPLLPIVAPAPRAESSHHATPHRAILGAFVAFSVTGLFGSLTPTLVAGIDPAAGAAVPGIVAAVFLSGAAAPVLASRRLGAPSPVVGVLLVLGGLAGTGAAFALGWISAFTLAGMICGAGAGLLFSASLTSALTTADPASAPRASADVFAAAYAGLAVPVIAAGRLLDVLPVPVVLLLFTLLTAALGALAVRRHRRPAERPHRALAEAD